MSSGIAELLLSVASIWELQVKHASGKLDLPYPADELARRFTETSNAAVLGIPLNHIRQLYRLPAIHRDPFDRMLVAQAVAENLTIITPDRLLAQYSSKVLW